MIDQPSGRRRRQASTREGTLRRAGLEDDGLHDLAVFSLLDEEL
jgi:hypothetical protein